MAGEMPEGVRVFLVGENDDYWDGLCSLLAGSAVTVVGRAHAGGEALERAPALRPHVVLVDASLPDASGFEVTRRIRALPDPPRVFLLTFHQSQAVEAEALAAGAFGCLDKTEVAHLFAGIRGPFPRNPEPPSPTGRNR